MVERKTAQSAAQPKSDQNIAYVRQMLGELRFVAEREGAPMLSYLIEMAFMEAGDELDARRRAGANG